MSSGYGDVVEVAGCLLPDVPGTNCESRDFRRNQGLRVLDAFFHGPGANDLKHDIEIYTCPSTI